MIAVRAEGVKPSPANAPSPVLRRIPFAFRADPIALDDLGLDTTARSTFVLILDNAKDRGWKSRLSNATIGKILGRCPMTISRALGRLEAAGLVRRELIAGGRIRLAIHVTWEGVRREDLTEQAPVRREDLTGSARAQEGLGAGVEQIRAPIQSERSDGGTSPSIGGKEAADYLRRCVAAAKAGEPMPEPPGSVQAQPAAPAVEDSRPTPRVEAIEPKSVTSPVPHPQVALSQVGRMVRALDAALKADDVGPRRVGPAKSARQLAEMRRRRSRRG